MTRLRTTIVRALILLSLVATWSASAAELQGHRGARGLMPENTLVGFAHALALGVHTLELDLVMSADGVLMVSHDRLLSPNIVRDANARWLSAPGPAVFSLTRAELAAYDVGRIAPESRYAGRFPGQRAVDGTRMPSFEQVVDLVRSSGASNVRFNVETKLRPDSAGQSPTPERFADAVVALVRKHGLSTRVSVQSFDWRTLARVQQIAPEIETVCLTVEQRWLDNLERGQPGASPWTAGHDLDDHDGSVPRLVKAAGAAVWSPYYKEVTRAAVDEAHALGLRVVVWTVNEEDDIREMLALGVDGVITDYPDRARRVFAAEGVALPPPHQVVR